MRLDSKGFSFLELMIAMIIMTILAISVFPALSLGKRQQMQTNENLLALGILEKEMHQLRAVGAKSLVVGTTNRTTTLDQDGLAGKVTVEIKPGPLVEEKFVRVNFSWGIKNESSTAYLYQE